MAPCEFSEIPQNQEVNVHFSSAVQRRASARERRESPIGFAFCKFARGTFQRSAAPILG
jgi:hypothetical protein